LEFHVKLTILENNLKFKAMPKRFAEMLRQSYLARTSGFLDISAKTALFKEISSILGGVFSKTHTTGNVLASFQLAIPYKKWEIVITESDTRPLKFQIGFETSVDFEFIIGIEDFFDKMLKKIDKTEIKVGDKSFDNQYLIHSSDPTLTCKLLTDITRHIIQKHHVHNIAYLTDIANKSSELISVINRTIEDKEGYLDLIDLHQSLIDSMLALGAINDRQ
jgi:hypothetical protein